MSDGLTVLGVALARLNPTLEDLISWLSRAGEPHTYDEIPGIHDHDCEACAVRKALMEVRERRGEVAAKVAARAVRLRAEAQDGR